MKEQAERTHGVLMSMRRIYHHQFINSGLELTPETLGFLPAHAMNRISLDLDSWVADDFTFNNVSDFPRNPKQAADVQELAVMAFFRENPSQKVYFDDFVDAEGQAWFQYARPIWLEEYCIKCHGKQSDAPPAIRNLYDTAFNYKAGDLRGLMSIRLSAEAINKRHAEDMITTAGTNLGMFILSFFALSFLTQRFINKPISDVVRQVNLVARGTEGARVPTISGEFSFLAESVNDMAQKIENDRSTLLANEETYRTLLEGTNAAPWSLNLETFQFIYLGPQFESMFHITNENLTDFDSWIALVHPEDRKHALEIFQETILTKSNHQQEFRIISHNDKEIWVKSVATVITDSGGSRMLGFLIEINDQKKIDKERQALHAQRIESLSILAGGVAHDFNNILSGILGHADLVLMDLEANHKSRNDVNAIVTASQRAADLAGQMLAFSGQGNFQNKKIHFGNLVEETIQMLNVSISQDTTITFDCIQNLPTIMGDPTQIRQIVMNLITNASEAIGKNAGSISITVGKMICKKDFIQSLNPIGINKTTNVLPGGPYVFMEVADTGCGMDEETKQKIFDPFFTTKFTGRGLGLAAVQGIVRGHNGAIMINSEAAKGTTFKVLFPQAENETTSTECPSSPELEQWSGSGTILLVDDDMTVLEVSGRMLNHLGFEVISANNGPEAIEIFKQQGSQISCVLLDLTMPEMDGKKVYQEIRQLSHDVAVVMSSGYNEQDLSNILEDEALTSFIQKPYQMAELQIIFHEILG